MQVAQVFKVGEGDIETASDLLKYASDLEKAGETVRAEILQAWKAVRHLGGGATALVSSGLLVNVRDGLLAKGASEAEASRTYHALAYQAREVETYLVEARKRLSMALRSLIDASDSAEEFRAEVAKLPEVVSARYVGKFDPNR